MKLGITTLVLVIISSFVAGYFWWSDQLTAPQPGSQSQVTLNVSPDETATGVIANLASLRLIKSPFVAKVYLKFTGLDQKIRPGSYTLSPAGNLPDLFAALTSGPKDIKITIPEGWRREQIASRLAANLTNFDSASFIHKTATLEGQLFPDTYLIPPAASVSDVIAIFTSNFTDKTHLNPKSKTDLDNLILASLVEREARYDADRPTIAGILIKRLDQGWPLQVDAALQYAQGKAPDWWAPVTDTQLASPYNTYLHSGLPPAPIANPGLAAITAVLHPQNTDYWYYLTGTDGITYYARTLAQHNLNIDKYLKR